MRWLLIAALALTAGCATQRYGRMTEISAAEAQMMDCREVRLETVRAEQFLSQIRIARRDTSAAHVLGFMADFGIGNVMEGDAAELSGERRLAQLRELSARKNCQAA
jgi:hypothetical protein